MAKNDLEERLIRYAISIITIAEGLPKTFTGNQLSSQMIRSSSSSAMNYGEAQSAESPRDFVHKLKIVLKELRETYVNLRIVDGVHLYSDQAVLGASLKESNELISIFVKSIDTARRNAGLGVMKFESPKI